MMCWVASYTLLPTIILRFAKNARVYLGDPVVGNVLARIFGFRRHGLVLALTLASFAIAGIVTVKYIADDPFEYDIKNLRSEGADALDAREWMRVSDANFGRGHSGRTYIAADRPDQVPKIIEALRKLDA